MKVWQKINWNGKLNFTNRSSLLPIPQVVIAHQRRREPFENYDQVYLHHIHSSYHTNIDRFSPPLHRSCVELCKTIETHPSLGILRRGLLLNCKGERKTLTNLEQISLANLCLSRESTFSKFGSVRTARTISRHSNASCKAVIGGEIISLNNYNDWKTVL